jgi:hypothetical protein
VDREAVAKPLAVFGLFVKEVAPKEGQKCFTLNTGNDDESDYEQGCDPDKSDYVDDEDDDDTDE